MSDAGKPRHRVSLLNDEHTPMEFVIQVLEKFFDMDTSTANARMHWAHSNGSVECGIYPHDQAVHSLAAFKAAERRYEEDTDILYRRLVKAFPKAEIERDIDFVGSSTHTWPVAAMVKHQSHVALFEPVNKHHTSVVNAAVKFHDIARLDNPPKRIAVVKRKQELGNYINVLAQAASVIEYEVPDETLIRLAEAA
jgi:ATP-dependent Clp protease adapter protein ClpS